MTYQDLVQFEHAANLWLQGKLEGGKPPVSKLTYATERLLKRAKPILEAYHERIEDLRIDHAEEKDGVLVGGQLTFSKDGLKKCNVAIRNLAREQVNLEPFLVKVVPQGLPYGLQAALTGFVLPEPDDQEPAA